MSRTPNYVLTEDHNFGPFGDQKTLEVGSFVRPIEYIYVPKHCLEKGVHNRAFSYCYTRYGIILIPNALIRKTS